MNIKKKEGKAPQTKTGYSICVIESQWPTKLSEVILKGYAIVERLLADALLFEKKAKGTQPIFR